MMKGENRRERVYKTIRLYTDNWSGDSCRECPYKNGGRCFTRFCEDVLALLEARKPQRVTRQTYDGKFGKCPTCGAVMHRHDRFCSHCGQEVKWE